MTIGVLGQTLPSCWYCGRTAPGVELKACCRQHPQSLICRDVEDCRDFLLDQLNAIRE